MSDTPRSDAATDAQRGTCLHGYGVTLAFARILERELNAAQRDHVSVAKWREVLNGNRILAEENDRLRRELAIAKDRARWLCAEEGAAKLGENDE